MGYNNLTIFRLIRIIMAKKGQRQLFALLCTVCKSQNYLTEKNKVNTPDKLEFNKFCKTCRKVTPHKESQKLE